MSQLRQRARFCAGCHRDRDKDKAPWLLRLGVLDITCNLHLRPHTYYSRNYKFKDENQDKNPQRGCVSGLRQQMESQIRKERQNEITSVLCR